MKKPQIRSVIPHFVSVGQPNLLPDRIADFHAQIIERRINQYNLTTEQKLTVIDQIIVNLRSRNP